MFRIEVLIITDNEELDDKLKKLYTGIDEESIEQKVVGTYKCIESKNRNTDLIWFTSWKRFREGDYNSFIEEIKESIGSHLELKGMFVFL